MGNHFLIFLYLLITISVISGRNNSKPTTAKPVFDVLSKLHQNDYKIIYERCELSRSDPSLITAEIRTFKFNRTTPVTNGSFVLTTNLGYQTEVILQMYKFASNEYRSFPMRFQFKLCEALASKAFGMNKLSESGNLICPLVKEKKYFFYNFAPNESQFPPLIPSGRYLLELQFLYHSKEVIVVNNYGIIHRPLAIPKF